MHDTVGLDSGAKDPFGQVDGHVPVPVSARSGACAPTSIAGIHLSLAFALLALTGCGTLHGSAQAGSGMKPRFGTSISLPLGK